jgi:hypothetical protein
MSYLFPATFALNTFAITTLMIGLSLGGHPTLAAEVGIVQGATLVLFFAFSANARNTILNPSSRIPIQAILVARLLLLLPLGLASLYLSVSVGGVEAILAVALILRRCTEWIGEVHLSEMEVRRRDEFALRFITLQALLLVLALAGMLSGGPFRLAGVFVWALVPLAMSLGFIRRNVGGAGPFAQAWPQMWPHLGSTAMIGITVYIFRLLILLIVGKQLAGDLYAAFALGSLPGAVYGSALGPSLVLHEGRSGQAGFHPMLNGVLALWVLAGGIAVLWAVFGLAGLAWLGKSPFFWLAIGLSMLGGAVMVFAQRIRVRVLQLNAGQDVFGPDVLMNMLIVAVVPYTYHLLGLNALTGLYLLNAALALVFYASCGRGVQAGAWESSTVPNAVKGLIAFLLFFPVFFQLTGNIFNYSATFVFDSQGLLRQVPIPVSVFGCLAGILLLGGYKRAKLSLGVIFLSFMLMILATAVSTHGQVTEEEGKLVLLFQFVVPMAALVLGQLYGSRERDGHLFARVVLYVLAVVTPLQLVFTWYQGHILLSPYLYLFSIYQHLQYVPAIFTCAYVFALFYLWEVPRERKILLLLAPILGMYAGASMSILAMVVLSGGAIGFALYQWGRQKDRWILVSSVLTLAGLAGYLALAQKADVPRTYNLYKFGYVLEGRSASGGSSRGALTPNVADRLRSWEYFAKGIGENSRVLLFGHARRPSRAEYPSAHNYFLDFVFNFGVIALTPLLAVIGYTLVLVFRHRATILGSPGLVGLTSVVLFLVLVDNSLKVGLRQPYPGIMTFFLWGLWLSRVSVLRERGGGKEGVLAEGPERYARAGSP